ncbi:response regulator receiver domain protein [Oscillibacter sp. KLE 1728]|nr:response regulator receiver domain protein [Oscillibacter sp. KLE 1728]ERK68486.1 response regulator receiver domain protein [Oscillibacter sp. KLE 1745]
MIITERRELYQQLIESLRNTCLEIDYAASYVQAVNRCSRFHYILIILDIHFSEMNGMAVVRRLRQLEQAPILVLSTCYSRQEEIEVLNAGADAYLPVEGPLDQELLLAHASALMRRYLSANTREYATIQIADIGLKINLNLRKAFLNGENLRLTPKQFDILQLLVDRIGEIVTKEELFEIAWKGNYDIYADDAIKYHIRELRKKLGQHGMAHLIETAWGVGYQICLENE